MVSNVINTASTIAKNAEKLKASQEAAKQEAMRRALEDTYKPSAPTTITKINGPTIKAPTPAPVLQAPVFAPTAPTTITKINGPTPAPVLQAPVLTRDQKWEETQKKEAEAAEARRIASEKAAIERAAKLSAPATVTPTPGYSWDAKNNRWVKDADEAKRLKAQADLYAKQAEMKQDPNYNKVGGGDAFQKDITPPKTTIAPTPSKTIVPIIQPQVTEQPKPMQLEAAKSIVDEPFVRQVIHPDYNKIVPPPSTMPAPTIRDQSLSYLAKPILAPNIPVQQAPVFLNETNYSTTTPATSYQTIDRPDHGPSVSNAPITAPITAPSVTEPIRPDLYILGSDLKKNTSQLVGLLPDSEIQAINNGNINSSRDLSPETQRLLQNLSKTQQSALNVQQSNDPVQSAIRRKLDLSGGSSQSVSPIRLNNSTPATSPVVNGVVPSKTQDRREVNITEAPTYKTGEQSMPNIQSEAIKRRVTSSPTMPSVGTRDWNSLVAQKNDTKPVDSLNLEREAIQRRLSEGTLQQPSQILSQTDVPKKSSFDIQRSQVEGQAEQEKQRARQAFEEQMASQGIAKGSGIYESQLREFDVNSRKELGSRLGSVNLSEAQALEARREAELGRTQQTKERLGTQDFAAAQSELGRLQQTSERLGTQDFAAVQEDLNRSLTQSIETGKLTMQAAQLAQEGAKFDNEMQFKKYALDSGYEENDIQRAWQEIEASKDRVAQTDIQKNELDFKTWATQAGFDENEVDRSWKEIQNSQALQHEADLLGISNQFKASQSDIDRALTRDIEQGKMDQQTADRIQQASEFSDELKFKEWATNTGIDDAQQDRIWQSSENMKKLISSEKLNASDQQFKQAMVMLEDNLGSGRMTLQDSIQDQNILTQNTADSYYKMGAVGGLTEAQVAELKTKNPLYYNSYISGSSAKSFDDYTRETENEISYRNALISGLDPKDVDFNKKLNQIAVATGMVTNSTPIRFA